MAVNREELEATLKAKFDARTYEQTRTIQAEDLVDLILANDWDFERIKRERGIGDGVTRKSADEIRAIEGFNTYLPFGTYTFVHKTRVVGDVRIFQKNLNNLRGLVFFQSEGEDFIVQDGNAINREPATKWDIRVIDSRTKNVIINNSTTGSFSIYGGSTTGSFSIYGGSTTGSFSIYGGSTTGYFRIYGGSTTGYFSIDGGSTTGYFSVEGGSHLKAFHADNCSIKSLTSINSIINNLSLDTRLQMDALTLTTSQLALSITAAVIGEVRVTGCNLTGFSVRQMTKLEAYFSNCDLHTVDLSQINLGKDAMLNFSASRIGVLRMQQLNMLGSMFFRKVSPLPKDSMRWLRAYVKATRVKQNLLEVQKGKLIKNHLNAYKARRKALNVKRRFIPFSSEARIQLIYSSLGKTEFSNVDFAAFEFQYSHSKMTEAFITGGSIPKDVQIVNLDGEPVDKESAEAHEQRASFYNQFKKIAEGQGDVYRATQYQAKWAGSAVQYLKQAEKLSEKDMLRFVGAVVVLLFCGVASGLSFYASAYGMGVVLFVVFAGLLRYVWPRFKPYTSAIAQDIYTLRLNQLSNNHGESWLGASLFVVVGAILTFIPTVISLEYAFAPDLILHPDRWNSLGHFFSLPWKYRLYFFEFLNPTHAFGFIAKAEKELGHALKPGLLSGLWDFVGRVLVGFGIYQFVAAFRKHGKKG